MKKVFILLSAALVAFSCNKVVENQSNIDEKPIVESDVHDLTLKFDESLTKASLDIDGATATLNWKAGDVIGIKLSDDSVISGTVSIDGDLAKVTVDLGGKTVSDVWFPYNGGTKPEGVPVAQSFDTINVPLGMSSIDGSIVTLSSIEPWCLVRISLKNGTRGALKTINQVKVKTNTAAHTTPFTIGKNQPLSTSEAVNFDFVIPADDSAQLEVIVVENTGSYNKEYRRKRSSTLDLVEGKTYSLPVEVDDTGKHRWVFGDNAATSSEADTPLYYWFQQKGDWNADKVDVDNMVSHPDHVTYTMLETSAGTANNYRSNLTLIRDKKYANNYSTEAVSTARNTSFPVYGTLNAGGQIPFLAVHSGNYPIFAVKMSNPDNYGTGRHFRIRVDARANLDDVPLVENCVDNLGNKDNIQTYIEKTIGGYAYSSTSDVAIMYYNLSNQVIGSKSVIIPNTRVVPFNSWQIRFIDVNYAADQDSAPTYDVYWAGFFNSVNELEEFAASH